MGFAILNEPAPHVSPMGSAKRSYALGYGTDPNLINPVVPWPSSLSGHEKELISAFSDIVLPGTASAPTPTSLNIVAFFDDWLSAPYPTQTADASLIRTGFEILDHLSIQMFQADFLSLPLSGREAVVNAIASGAGDNFKPGRKFFVRFRFLLIGGYYTSDRGMNLIGYRGNKPLSRYEGVSADGRNAIEAELRRLGL